MSALIEAEVFLDTSLIYVLVNRELRQQMRQYPEHSDEDLTINEDFDIK